MTSLAGFSLFADAEIDFEEFDQGCMWKKYESNQTVVDFQEPSTDVFLIVAGKARVFIRTSSNKEAILADLRGGEIFGELAAIDGVPRSAKITVMNSSEICIVPAPVFRGVLSKSPIVCERALRVLASRIRVLERRLAELSVLDLKHRLYAEILRLSQPRAGHESERVITPPPYHHTLATRVGCRREQVTRELSAMEKQGLVKRNRGGLVILTPDALKARLSEALSDDV